MSIEASRWRALDSASLVWGLFSGWTSQVFISGTSHDVELFYAHKHLVTRITPVRWKPAGAFLPLGSLVLISDSQFHGLGSLQLSPQFLLMNSELMLLKSCVLSGRLCFSRWQTHTQLPHQIVFKKNKAQQALCGLRWHCERFDGHREVLVAASGHLPAFSLLPFIFHSSSTRSTDVQPLPPVEQFSLDRPQPTSSSRGWVTGKCVSSHLKLSPRQSPKNNRFCSRGTFRE